MFVQGRVDVASFETPPPADVVTLAKRMVWQPMREHGFPARFAARIEIDTGQGVVSAEVAQVRGAPDRPVDQADIIAKFTGNATRRLDATRVQQLMDIILNIDTMPETNDLARLLA
jgi:2-methylcitrate dehydratase PrpD